MWRTLCLLALPFLTLDAALAAETAGPDLSRIERRINREPTYQGKPGYLLLVLGPEARHKAWLVVDGNTLFVDRFGTGNLDQPECRVEGKPDPCWDLVFEAGDLMIEGQRYKNLQICINIAKNTRRISPDELPALKQLRDSNPDARICTVRLEMPFEKLLAKSDEKDAVKTVGRYAGPYDHTGVLQFAARPEDAPIVHFSNTWSFAPEVQYQLVRGRNVVLSLNLGTPGYGPGTFARVPYTDLLPSTARPRLDVEYPLPPEGKSLKQTYILKERCCHTRFYGKVPVPGEVPLGEAQVTLSMDGWVEGQVVPATYRMPVVPRPPLPVVRVSPEQKRVWSTEGYRVDQMHYTRDGKTLLVILSKPIDDERRYEFFLLDAETGRPRGKFFTIEPEPLKVIYGQYVVMSRDNKLVAVHYNLLRRVKHGDKYQDMESGQLHVFDLETGRELWHHDGDGWGVYGADFSPDSQTLVTGHTLAKETGEGRQRKRHYTGEVRFWDPKTGKRRPNLPGGPYQVLWSTKYSPDGKYVAFWDDHRDPQREQYYGVWDLSAEKMVFQVQGQNFEAAFSPCMKYLATSSSRWVEGTSNYAIAVTCWDLQTGQAKNAVDLSVGRGWVRHVSWSPDGKALYVLSGAGELWRWEPFSNDPPVKRESIAAELLDPSGREAWICDLHLGSGWVAFAVNGELPERVTSKRLPEDFDELPPPEIVLWDLKTLERRAVLTGHRGQICHLAFSPDGKTLVSGGTDGTLRFWDLTGIRERK